jgi:hypothetical protein
MTDLHSHALLWQRSWSAFLKILKASNMPSHANSAGIAAASDNSVIIQVSCGTQRSIRDKTGEKSKGPGKLPPGEIELFKFNDL